MKRILVALLLTCSASAIAANIPDAAADISITTNVAAPATENYGVNSAISGYANFNNYVADPGFEPFVLRKFGTVASGSGNFLVNGSPAGTTNYDILGDGFFDGASIRIYRSVAGKMTLLRSGTVTQYIGGWNRLTSFRITGTSYRDGSLVAGKTYYYSIRAYDTSGNQSALSNVATAIPLTGSGTAEAVTQSFTPVITDNVPPAAPTNCTATPNGDGSVTIRWQANSETDLAGYYVYRAESAPTEHGKIYFSGTGSDVAANDSFFLELNPANPPLDKLSPRIRSYFSENDTWRAIGGSSWPYAMPVTKERDTSTSCPDHGGKSSMKLGAPGPGSYEVSLRQYRYAVPDGYYGALVPGKTYRAEVWLKQEGITSGSVMFKMSGAYSSISGTWGGVNAGWKYFSQDFVAPGYPGPGATVEHMIAFNGPGTLWIDNFRIFDPTLPKFEFPPEQIEQLKDYAPSYIRWDAGHADGTWGSSMEDFTNEDDVAQNQFNTGGGRTRPDQPYHLPFALEVNKQTGSNPWLIVGSYMNEQEWLNLIEYLAGPAGTPYGDKRIAHRKGNTTPWSSEFSRIRLEYGNEMWNPVFEWTLNGVQHGQFAEYFFNIARHSPYFSALEGKVDFIVNGQLVSTGTNGYSSQAMQALPQDSQIGRNATHADLALYIGGWDAHITLGGGVVGDLGFDQLLAFSPTFGRRWFDLQASTRDQMAALGYVYKLNNYESGPGYGLPSPGLQYDPVVEAYGKSLAGGVATLDSFLYGSYKKIDPQCYFTFQTGVNWSSHGYLVNGNYPHPSWLAIRMKNKYVTGPMLGVALHDAPARDVAAWVNEETGGVQADAVSGMPEIGCYAFRDGAKYSVFVLSRKVSGSFPVTLRLPFTSISSGTLYKLTGSAAARNDQGSYNIQPTAEAVTGFSNPFTFQMPASSAYLFVFDGAVTPIESAPSCIVSRRVGQAAVTSSQEITFSVHFSQPVTGFTAADVTYGGSAQPASLTVTETDPYLGTDYTVTLSGMATSGDVWIQVGANAGVNSQGAGNLSPLVLSSTVQFNLPPFQAYDDFNLSPASAPNAPFLHGVNTGIGLSGSWQVQNFSAATYGDGFKLAANNPLVFGNLRRRGSYAVGGKDFTLATRPLDVDGMFSFYRVPSSNPAVVGRAGTTLWASALFRKDSNDTNRTLLLFTNGQDQSVGGSILGFGYNGDGTNALVNGTRYWSFHVRNSAYNGIDVIRSSIPVVTGSTALLVLKMTFGAQDRFDLFVNPATLGGTEPATPSATWTTTGSTDVTLKTLAFSGGTSGANQSSVDEIRFGRSFAEVTPTFTGQETWRMQWFGGPDASGSAGDTSDPDGDGIANLAEYALGRNPLIADRQGLPGPQRTRIGSDDYLTLEIPKAATDVIYRVEVSTDLLHWSSAGTDIEILEDTAALLRVRDRTPLGSATQRFIRCRVQQP